MGMPSENIIHNVIAKIVQIGSVWDRKKIGSNHIARSNENIAAVCNSAEKKPRFDVLKKKKSFQVSRKGDVN